MIRGPWFSYAVALLAGASPFTRGRNAGSTGAVGGIGRRMTRRPQLGLGCAHICILGLLRTLDL